MDSPFTNFTGYSPDIAESDHESTANTPFLAAEMSSPFLNNESAQAELEQTLFSALDSEEWENETGSGESHLSISRNLAATRKNLTLTLKSNIPRTDLINAIAKTIDFGGIRKSLTDANRSASQTEKYLIDLSGQTVDSVFTEAVYQFQIRHFLNPKEHDGILGSSTMDTLGFIGHGLRPKLNSSGFYGQGQLNRGDVKAEIAKLTNNEFTSANWFNFIMRPAWLGVKISSGVHVLLLRELRKAEQWLMSQPQYHGMTEAQLGKALGFHKDSTFSGARLSSAKQAMHGFGLAIDINVPGNPWIGAGWVSSGSNAFNERFRMIQAFRAASGNHSLPGQTVFAYLHSIAQNAGANTRNTYDELKRRNDEFIAYLRNNKSELDYWKRSSTFGKRNPLNGFLNLHSDLVFALRHIAGLAWGAVDFGPRASGDVMHFDLRTIGFGKFICGKIRGFVPSSGHPTISHELSPAELREDFEDSDDSSPLYELHEAIEEATWQDKESGYDQSEDAEDVDFQYWDRSNEFTEDQDRETPFTEQSETTDQYAVAEETGDFHNASNDYDSEDGTAAEKGLTGDYQHTTQETEPIEEFIPSLFHKGNLIGSKIKAAYQWGSKNDMAVKIHDIVVSTHPQLAGKKVDQMTKDEKDLFKATWIKTRTELFNTRNFLVRSGFTPALGGAEVPFGFVKVKYGSHEGLRPDTDYPLYKTDRLDTRLHSLHGKGKISLNQEELDVFQRIANVETGGRIQTLNSYDAGIVSIGFMQFTLHVGKIQEWIQLNANAFKRYGIELDPTLKYTFTSGKYTNSFPAIKGIPQVRISELRKDGWAERFYYAGLDDDVIAAEVILAREYLSRHLKDLRARLKNNTLYDTFINSYYGASLNIKGLFQESHNNNPSRSTQSVLDTLQYMTNNQLFSVTDFLDRYKDEIRGRYGDRIVDATSTGTNLRL